MNKLKYRVKIIKRKLLILKIKLNLNKYNLYLEKSKKYINQKKKIEEIYNYLISNLENDTNNELIKEIERQINERRKI